MTASAPIEKIQPALVRITPYSLMILLICVLISMVEGYDVQTMALAAPGIAARWSLTHGQTGLLFSISVVGMILGSLILAPLGDIWGRRPCIILALLAAAACTAAAALTANLPSLLAARLLAGFALGFALPNVLSIGMELAPPHWRTLSIVLMSCGYPLGAAVGSAAIGPFIASHGPPIVFLCGGAASLAVSLLCAAILPESPAILSTRPHRADELMRTLHRTGRNAPYQASERTEAATPREAIQSLFARERRFATLMLWTLSFSTLALVYFFVNWLPTLFVARGLTTETAILASSLFLAAGVLGGLSMIFILPRAGAVHTLRAVFIIIVITALLMASTTNVGSYFLIVLGIAGAAIFAAQFSLNAVVARFYPSTIRATAIGYAAGVGRLGAILAPLVGGFALNALGSPKLAFGLPAIPAALAVLAVLALARHTPSFDQSGR